MPDRELTDEQVLAELREDERQWYERGWFRAARKPGFGVPAVVPIVDALARLAAARREARELREQPCRVVGRVTQHCATCAEAVREAVGGDQRWARVTVTRAHEGGAPDALHGSEEVGMGNSYVIVRTYSAGVFFGTLVRRDGREVELTDARRLWFWSGAASLSELAVRGPSRPKDCKFPAAVPRVVLTEAIEILDVTDEARAAIEAVPVWSA